MALSSKSIGIAFVSSLLLFRPVLGWTCFFPDGDVASNYIPCSPNNDGDCCVDGDLCTSLGYCLSNTHAFYYRGACTDQAWGNPSCPKYCLADENSGNSSAVSVIPCDAAAANGGTWCCAYDGNCCSESTYTPYFGTIIDEEGTPQTTPTLAVSTTPVIQPSTAPSSPVFVPTTTTPSQPQTSQISESAETSQVLQASQSSQTSKSSLITSQTSQTSQISQTPVTSTSRVAITTPTQQSQISPTSTSTPQKTDHTGIIVGAAVGIPLGLAALVALLLLLRERKKRQRDLAAPLSAPETSTYVYFGSDGSISKDVMMAQDQALKKYAEAAIVPKQELVAPPRFELSSHDTPELDGGGWRPNNF